MSNSQLVMDAGVAVTVRELRELNPAERAEQAAQERRAHRCAITTIPARPGAIAFVGPRVAPWLPPSRVAS